MTRYQRWKERYGTLFVVAVALILFFNLLFALLLITNFPPAEDLYSNGLIVRIPSLHYAMVFAHGGYITRTLNDGTNATFHAMEYRGNEYATFLFVDELHDEGYTRIWGSWCETGDHNYTIRIEAADGTVDEIPWPSYVSRNTFPGRTTPFFIGVGFIRIPDFSRMLNSRSMEEST